MYKEGSWVEYDSRKALTWNDSWFDGEPNDFGVSGEDCSVIDLTRMKYLDVPCLTKMDIEDWGCVACEVSEKFVLKGVRSPVDTFYFAR